MPSQKHKKSEESPERPVALTSESLLVTIPAKYVENLIQAYMSENADCTPPTARDLEEYILGLIAADTYQKFLASKEESENNSHV